MKATPLDDLEMFELLRAAYPEKFMDDENETWESAQQFADEISGWEDVADQLGRIVMRYAKDFDPATPVIENCKYMQALGKIQQLEGVLDAVKKWDIDQAINNDGGLRFALPETIRKQIQAALSA